MHLCLSLMQTDQMYRGAVKSVGRDKTLAFDTSGNETGAGDWYADC